MHVPPPVLHLEKFGEEKKRPGLGGAKSQVTRRVAGEKKNSLGEVPFVEIFTALRDGGKKNLFWRGYLNLLFV